MQYRNLSRKKTKVGKNNFTIFCAIFIVVSIIFGAVTIGTHALENPTTLYVPKVYPTIQDAVNAADPGDIIEVKAGVYTENIQIDKPLILKGINHPIIDGEGNYFGFDLLTDDIKIEGFTISNISSGEYKAAIRIFSNNNIIKNNIISDNLGCGIVIYESQNNHLSQNFISKNQLYALRLWHASKNTIENNAITQNQEGIYAESGDENSIFDNTISANNNGIKLINSNDTTISTNLLELNNYALHLKFSHNNYISENTINENIIGGYTYQSHQNKWEKNTITSHKLQGIRLEQTDENEIVSNTMTSNKYGVYLASSQQNLIWNNYFENTHNALDDGTNQWTQQSDPLENIIGGPYRGGNFWDDYTGGDADYNGLGESPYLIDGGTNQDTNPLVSQANYAPNDPANPNPAPQSNSVDINTDISWTAHDHDDAILRYTIYFGGTTPPPLVKTDATTNSFDPGTLEYSTTYYWQITVTDPANCSATSNIWSFTTASPNTGGGGSSTRSTSRQTTNEAPEISTGGPYAGFAGYPIQFDASESTDDEIISSYMWDFGDGTTATGPTPKHSYATIGIYTVGVTVSDNQGKQTTDTTQVTITNKPNNPPSTPSIEGSLSGTKETTYTYTIVATDEDADLLQYTIDWGDQTVSQSEQLSSNEPYTVTHEWSTPGRYSISVQASDGTTITEHTFVMMIDAQPVKSIGYLFDTDGNGRYDQFYCNSLQKNTEIGGQNDVYYLNLDTNNDWDYQYNSVTEELTAYVAATQKNEQTVSPFLWFVLIGVVCTLIFLLGTLFIISREKQTLRSIQYHQNDQYSNLIKRIDTLIEEHEKNLRSG